MDIQFTPLNVDEIVLIKGKPRKVFVEVEEEQEIHYFYWALDLYKPFDYEPVKVEKVKRKDVYVYTRYHWRGLIIWTSPMLVNGKPLISFARGVHTPLVYSSIWLYIPIIPLKIKFDLEEELWLTVYLNILYKLMKGILKLKDLKDFEGYRKLVVYESVPKKYKFKLNNWHYLIIVGQYPKYIRKEVKKRLRELLSQ
jgi:hypothetical protein